VAVLAQGGAGVGVPKALLGVQEVAVGDQDGRDRVSQRGQAHPGMSVGTDESRNQWLCGPQRRSLRRKLLSPAHRLQQVAVDGDRPRDAAAADRIRTDADPHLPPARPALAQ